MKIIIYAFSGTGNTLAVARLYKKYLECGENTVDIYRISKKNAPPPAPDGFDMIGVAYPIHAFSAPEPIIKFCKALPAASGAAKPAFVFKTSGEGLHVNDGSSNVLLRILKKKNYDVLTERHIVMPYNMIYRHNDEMAKQMWIYAHALADANCRDLISGKRDRIKRFYVKRVLFAPIGGIERHFAHLHGTAFKVDAKKCVGCDRCINVCPQNNIMLKDGKYKFGHACVLCMNCSFGCPKDAVKVGLFKFWKVNGDYGLDALMKDESIAFPFVPDKAKGIYRLYKKYYRDADKRLAARGISVYDYISPTEDLPTQTR